MTNHFSMISLFFGGSFIITISSLIMIAGSILSWCVIVEKLRLWKSVKRGFMPDGKNPDEIIKPFDKNLWFLSMASTVAPFIGLFGTVWGVIGSFASIGAAKSVSIAVVAPGLAQALGTTALGLMVAIPAAVFYQYFSKKSDELYNELSNDKKK